MEDLEFLDLEEIDVFVNQIKSAPVVKDALENGVNLESYQRDIENQLRNLEKDSVQDYVDAAASLTSLHADVNGTDQLLLHMSNLLNGFQEDLGNLSKGISNLQKRSLEMGIQLKNRRTVEESMRQYLHNIMVEPSIVMQICDGDINESYIQSLIVLNAKLDFLENNKSEIIQKYKESQESVPSLHEIEPYLQKLKFKAIARIREFLLYRVYSLRKPKTNIQILQQTLLIKYTYLNEFLYKYQKLLAEEVKNVYCDTVGKVFLSYFKTYITNLSKLQCEIATKNDLLGNPENNLKLVFTKKTHQGVFTLGNGNDDRSAVLHFLDMPSIVPHVAEQQHQKFPYERIYRSISQLLIDTISAEFLFGIQFFSNFDFANMFNLIFDKILQTSMEAFQAYVNNSYDALGILLMVGVTQQHAQTMKRRRIPYLDSYFQNINSMLWNRFHLIFDMNIDSIRKAIQSPSGVPGNLSMRPHFIARRYAEFVGSIKSLRIDFAYEKSNANDTMENRLLLLRNFVQAALTQLARTFKDKKHTYIFLICNYDLILTILEERASNSEEIGNFKQLHGLEVKNFVEEELSTFYGALINFVRSEGSSQNVEIGEVERLVKEFSNNWKSVIEQMKGDVVNYFSDFRSGSDILKQLLSQLALYYSRFEDIVKKNYKNAPFRKDIVPISTLRFEIQKYLTHSF